MYALHYSLNVSGSLDDYCLILHTFVLSKGSLDFDYLTHQVVVAEVDEPYLVSPLDPTSHVFNSDLFLLHHC